MFVSTRFPILLTLVLLIATLQPYNLLLTEQSSLVPNLRHQMNANINANLALLGSLGGQPPMPLDAQRCMNASNSNPNALTALAQCGDYQLPWLALLKENRVPKVEYKCKDTYCTLYCENMVARKYCLPNQYASFLKVLEQNFDNQAQDCQKWINWKPKLDTPPAITYENIECQDILAMNAAGERCTKEVADKIASQGSAIKDPTELLCKTYLWGMECTKEEVCKYCTKSGNEYLDFVDHVWSPAKVECTNWTSMKPKMQCSTQPNPNPSGSCLAILKAKRTAEKCDKQARDKHPEWFPWNVDPVSRPEEWKCKGAFYSFDCGMKAACDECSDPKDYVDYASKELDRLIRRKCIPWSSEAPKFECSSSSTTLLIGGIVTVVLLAILVVITSVLLCWLCCKSNNKSGPRSLGSKGGSSTPKQSRIKAGSSIGAKQASRLASTGEPKKKQKSRVLSGAKPGKQSKRSRA